MVLLEPLETRVLFSSPTGVYAARSLALAEQQDGGRNPDVFHAREHGARTSTRPRTPLTRAQQQVYLGKVQRKANQTAAATPASAPAGAYSIINPVEGVNFAQDGSNNQGDLSIPPDPTSATGIGFVITVVNNSIEIYKKNGKLELDEGVAGFFSTLNPNANDLFDPKIVYDQYAGRFVIVMLEEDDNTQVSRILVAQSNGDNPNAGWNYLAINSATRGHRELSWTDFPGLAVDQSAIYVTGNLFGFDSGNFNGSRLWIIDKSALALSGIYDPSSLCNLPEEAFAMQPAHVYGTTNGSDGTMLVSTGWTATNNDDVLSMIHVQSPLNNPTFSNQYVDVGALTASYNPAPAMQKGTTQTIDVGDSRALSVVWRDNAIWMANTIDPRSGSRVGLPTAHWYEISTVHIRKPALLDQGDVSTATLGSNVATYYPSLAVDKFDDLGINYSASSPSMLPSAYVTGRQPTDPAGSTRQPALLAAGLASYYRTFGNGDNRWGDYSALSIDPNDDATFWAYNEYAVGQGMPLDHGENGQWGTRLGEFIVTDPGVPIPVKAGRPQRRIYIRSGPTGRAV